VDGDPAHCLSARLSVPSSSRHLLGQCGSSAGSVASAISRAIHPFAAAKMQTRDSAVFLEEPIPHSHFFPPFSSTMAGHFLGASTFQKSSLATSTPQGLLIGHARFAEILQKNSECSLSMSNYCPAGSLGGGGSTPTEGCLADLLTVDMWAAWSCTALAPNKVGGQFGSKMAQQSDIVTGVTRSISSSNSSSSSSGEGHVKCQWK
jgi:hypothetical protein